MKDIRQMLKDARARKGWSMRETAKRSKVPLSTLSKLESGALSNPTLATMALLNYVLGFELNDWMDEPKPKKAKRRAVNQGAKQS